MGIKQSIILGFVLFVSVLTLGQDEECAIGGEIFMPIAGMEDPTNLYQFSYPCSYYLLNASDKVIANNLRPAYAEGVFEVESPVLSKCNYGGSCPSVGTQVIGLCQYSAHTAELTQRAWYVAKKIVLDTQIQISSDAQVVEVPSVSVSNLGGGVVKIMWSAVPANDAVSKYRVVKSLDGLTNWTTVGDTTDLYLNDSPGIGTFYYALEIVFVGTPTVYCSRHGLLAAIVVEGE